LPLKSRLLFCALVLFAVVLPACNQIINNPAPELQTLSPDHVTAGQPAFTLILTGKNFTPTSIVEFKGAPRTTVFVSVSQMTAQILADDIQNPGLAPVTVLTPAPGGGTSAAVNFAINPAPSGVPQITKISPSSVFAQSCQITLSLSGTGFAGQSVVSVNGNNLPTAFINSTSLTAAIPQADFVSSGALEITVINPPPGGGTSNLMQLNITNAFPGITAVAPTSVQAGSTPPAISVTGAGLASNSVVVINGTERSSSFALSSCTNEAGTVVAALTVGDITSGGINQIQVFSPTPGGGTSNTLTFAVTPTVTAGLPVLVDVAPDGTQANDAICGSTCSGTTPDLTTAGPSVGGDGRFVVYASNSSNLIANHVTSPSNVYLTDTCLGQASCIPANFLVSTATTGGPANGPSFEPSVNQPSGATTGSGGTFVAFTSTATNLVTNVLADGTTRQVYWSPGCTASPCSTGVPVQLVSLSADGSAAGNADSFNGVVSPDGRYVAFLSLATNLVTGVTVNGLTPQVYLRDTCSGVTTSCTPKTLLVSSPDGTTPGNAASSNPAIAASGLFVSFTSASTNLGATAPNPQGAFEVFERSTCITLAVGCTPATNLISTIDGTTPAGGSSSEAAITPDGRFVAFASTATNLGTASGGVQQIYVRDTCIGQTSGCTPSTKLISTPNGTTAANGLSEHPSINAGTTTTTATTGTTGATGQFIAFASLASNLSANTQNGVENIYVRNTCVGAPATPACTAATALASVAQGTTPAPANGNSLVPSVSSDGKVVAFLSFASNLVPRDTNASPDIFLAATTF
jgi:hypothetical protein